MLAQMFHFNWKFQRGRGVYLGPLQALLLVSYSRLGAFCMPFFATQFTHTRHFHMILSLRMELLSTT